MRLEQKHDRQYDKILEYSVNDSHQYREADEMMRRCCDRLTHFQTHHVIEIDHEHYQPIIDRESEIWQSLYEWLHSPGGIVWLMKSKDWPPVMNKHLTFLSLKIPH